MLVEVPANFTGWAVIKHHHVVPANDTHKHVLAPDCWCEPSIEEEADNYVIIHNAADRREVGERAAALGLRVVSDGA